MNEHATQRCDHTKHNHYVFTGQECNNDLQYTAKFTTRIHCVQFEREWGFCMQIRRSAGCCLYTEVSCNVIWMARYTALIKG
jgi:hypothetical protein